MLKPNACPMITSYNLSEESATTMNSDLIEISSSSDGNISDIDSEDLLETPATSDLDLSDNDSVISVRTALSVIDSSYKRGSSSLLESAIIDDIDGDKSSRDLDVISLSSTETSIENTNEVTDEQNCAVAICNKKARNHFDKLFFLPFPKEKLRCDAWWQLCGQTIKFDPSFKICSIHFKADDFQIILKKKNGQLYRQTYLKQEDIVPSLYLTPQEYTIFNRKRKNNINIENNSKIQKNSTENEECIIGSGSGQKDKKKASFSKKSKVHNIKQYYALKKINEDLIVVENPDTNDNSILWEPLELDEPMEEKGQNSENENSNNSDVVEYVSISSSASASAEQDNVKKKTKENVESTGDSVDTFVSNIPTKNLTPKLIKNKKTKSTSRNSFKEETIMVPKSKNRGNDSDYIYLDYMTGHGIENFVLFEEKSSIQKNIKTIIPEPEDKCSTEDISKAIMYNEYLIQNYGKMLPAHCDPSCQQACYNSITGPQRSEIFKEFRMLDNEPVRNCKITQLVKLRVIKNRYSTFDTYPVYRLMINKTLVKVCRTFFINTLGIPENRLNAILEPKTYTWFLNKDTVLDFNRPNRANLITEPVPVTDFVKQSLEMLKNDYKLFVSRSESNSDNDRDIGLEGVSWEEFEKIMLFLKRVPRLMSSIEIQESKKRYYFETSVNLDGLYMLYSVDYNKKNNHPPFTQCQFKKIYNRYMKTFLG